VVTLLHIKFLTDSNFSHSVDLSHMLRLHFIRLYYVFSHSQHLEAGHRLFGIQSGVVLQFLFQLGTVESGVGIGLTPPT